MTCIPDAALPAILRAAFKAADMHRADCGDCTPDQPLPFTCDENQALVLAAAHTAGGYDPAVISVETLALAERRDRYAAALHATLHATTGSYRTPWEELSPFRRVVWYHRADAAMALADLETATAARDTGRGCAGAAIDHDETGVCNH